LLRCGNHGYASLSIGTKQLFAVAALLVAAANRHDRAAARTALTSYTFTVTALERARNARINGTTLKIIITLMGTNNSPREKPCAGLGFPTRAI
jgi:hypothetical protein